MEEELQAKKYREIKNKHTVDFSLPENKKRLEKYENFVKRIYNESLVSLAHLEKRDKVLHNISEAFYKSSGKNYHFKLTGPV